MPGLETRGGDGVSCAGGREGAFAGATLPEVLTRLGAHRTHGVDSAALRAVWDELRDATRDVIRTAHFAAWWNADAITHVLQRDRGAPAGHAGARTLPSSLPPPLPPGAVTTYRGRGLHADVRGLQPNMRYKFTLRLVSPRSHSRLSPALDVWTAPAPPAAPCVARVEPKAVVLVWAPSAGGAAKHFCGVAPLLARSWLPLLVCWGPVTDISRGL